MNSAEEKYTSVERFLKNLEPEFVQYAPFLKELGFTSVNMLRFLKMKDLLKMPCILPAPHRRMILNAIVKLQSPETRVKVEIESPDSENMVSKKKKTDDNNSSDRASNLEPRKLFRSSGAEPTTTVSNSLYSNESQGMLTTQCSVPRFLILSKLYVVRHL